jgi:ABC-type sulfate transport system permease subunit
LPCLAIWSSACARAGIQFRGRQLLHTLIDLPFASPVIFAMVLVLLFRRQGLLGECSLASAST